MIFDFQIRLILTTTSFMLVILFLTPFGTIYCQTRDVPGKPQIPPVEPVRPGSTTAGAAATGIDLLRKTLNTYAWGSWGAHVNQQIEQKATQELANKPDGTSVVIHAGSTQRVDFKEMPHNAPPTKDSLVIDTIGKGTPSQAIENAFLVPAMRSDTQTHRVAIATKTQAGIQIKPVTQSDVQQVAAEQLRKVQAEAQRLELEARAQEAAKRTAEEAARRAAGEERRKAEEERKKAEDARVEAEGRRKEADERAKKYDDAIREARECRTNCTEKQIEAARQVELAQKYANTARCAESLDGPTSGVCGSPNNCSVCPDTLAMMTHQNDLETANVGLSITAKSLARIHRDIVRLGSRMGQPVSSAPVLRLRSYTIRIP